MAWAVLIVRVLVGLPFLVFGLDFFLKFMPPQPMPEGMAGAFIGALVATNYLAVVKVLEIVGGALVLTGRAAPLGLTLLVPVTVNIALWDILLVKFSGPPMGVILLAMELFLLFAYRKYFASVFTVAAKPG